MNSARPAQNRDINTDTKGTDIEGDSIRLVEMLGAIFVSSVEILNIVRKGRLSIESMLGWPRAGEMEFFRVNRNRESRIHEFFESRILLKRERFFRYRCCYYCKAYLNYSQLNKSIYVDRLSRKNVQYR